MGKSCCIEGCTVTSDHAEYFTFPVSKTLRAAWLEACGSAGGSVCEAHFTQDDYKCTRGRRRLRVAAVPSVALNRKPPPKTENEGAEPTDTADINKEDNEKASQNNSKEDKAETSIEVEVPVEESIKEKEIVEASMKESESVEAEDDKKTESLEAVGKKNTENKETLGKKKKETVDDVVKKKTDNVDVAGTREPGVCVKENGKNESSTESIQIEENDIEEMITNYQIKQTKTSADRLNPEPPELSSKLSGTEYTSQLSRQAVNHLAKKLESQLASRLAGQLANGLDNQLGEVVDVTPDFMNAAPVFIEVAIDTDATTNNLAAGSEDCLMLLESVQCDIDPSSLMLPEHGPDTDSDMEIVDVKGEDIDPISLLTSSDEDEVIIEEPHIDTVDLSSETDEDDRPLQRLIKKPKPTQKPKKKKYLLGMYEFLCAQCNYRTSDESEFKRHNLEFEHTTTIQICPVCNYTTASRAQFARHKRKHRDERNFKCHLCNYKARHNMSLTYHLKSHSVPNHGKTPVFTCGKCGFSSNDKSEGLRHIKSCDDGRFLCDLCSYSTKRRSDLKRHRMRRHSVDDTDQDFTA